MREILFRGKTEDGKWVEGVFIPDCLESLHNQQVDWGFIKRHWLEGEFDHVQSETVEVIRETVGQFTGLLDANGKKVFEGDILVFCKGATYPYQIEWDGMGWKLYRSDGKRIKEAFECNEIHYVNISEVIGNIHDNPELVEVKA